MEIGELVAVGFIEAMLAEECPYKQMEKDDCSEEIEEIENDDLDTNQADPDSDVSVHIQKNSGSKLGANLESGSQGAPGTTIDPPADASSQPKITEDRILVDGTGTPYAAKTAGKTFPYTVAAHHVIPGNASLRNSDLYKYLATAAPGSKVTKNIGYNVNGAHNGIFLPGWYGIRKKTSPNGQKWSELDQSWQQRYVGAVVARTARQFHDSHGPYNDAVKDILDTLAAALVMHKMFCEDCRGQEKTPPYYPVKTRLYALSGLIRSHLSGHPNNWKARLMASQKWTAYQLGDYKKDLRSLIVLNPIPADGG